MKCLPSTQKKSFHSSLKDRRDLDCYDRKKYTRESLLLEQKGGTSIMVDSLEGLDLTGVKDLTFGFSFNQPIERLDLKRVETLIFGCEFNQPVEGLDLKGVTSLTFDWKFNQPIEGLDLKGVETLTFGVWFNQKVEGLDLKGVTTLTFDLNSQFNRPIEGLDLKGVETLIFGRRFNQKIERLDLKVVKSLTFGGHFNQPIEGLDLKGVESLTFGYSFNQKVDGLDLKGVESLTFGFSFNQKVEGLDLKGVKSLTFGFSFNQPIEGLDLKGVTTLTFDEHSKFNQPVEGLDLKGVTTLIFGWNFNQPIKNGFLKEGLEYLKFEPSFLQNISPGVFPMSLERLESRDNFDGHPQKASLINGRWKQFKRDPRLIWSPDDANYRLDLERFCGDLDRFHIVNIRHILDYFEIAYSETDLRETLCNRLREAISPYLDEPLVTRRDLEGCDNREDPVLFEPLEGHPRRGLVRLERRDSRDERLLDSCFLKDSLRSALMADERCYRNERFNYGDCFDPLTRQRIPAEILDQIFSYEKDALRHRYANINDEHGLVSKKTTDVDQVDMEKQIVDKLSQLGTSALDLILDLTKKGDPEREVLIKRVHEIMPREKVSDPSLRKKLILLALGDKLS